MTKLTSYPTRFEIQPSIVAGTERRDIALPATNASGGEDHTNQIGGGGMKFRKKSSLIEATQWFKQGDHPKVGPMPKGRESKTLGWIPVLGGGYLVTPGDWIIRHGRGRYYPCRPDVFKQIYEEVPRNQCGETCERAKLCATCARGIDGSNG